MKLIKRIFIGAMIPLWILMIVATITIITRDEKEIDQIRVKKEIVKKECIGPHGSYCQYSIGTKRYCSTRTHNGINISCEIIDEYRKIKIKFIDK